MKNKSTSLNHRGQNLSSLEITEIINNLNSAADKNESVVNSISFSYNDSFGDDGAKALTELHLPHLTEIGLVGCNIGDEGGRQLLQWFKKMPQMRMICIEQNNFSTALKSEFSDFGRYKAPLLLVL